MEYNTSRPDLLFKEYGRNTYNLVQHLKTLPTKEERTQFAHRIVDLMALYYPTMKDLQDLKQKLWDHLFIMADYELDVEAPFPPPSPEAAKKKPEKVAYPVYKIKYPHYGRLIVEMLNKVREMEEGESRQAYVRAIANYMKLAYVTWNKDSVLDETILADIKAIGQGEIPLDGIEDLNRIEKRMSPAKAQMNAGRKSGGPRKGSRRGPRKN